MNLSQLLLLHLMAGAGVGVAVYLSVPGKGLQQAFQVLTAVLFWPLYLPLLLSAPGAPARQASEPAPPADELAQAIAHADSELEAALRSLDGWAEDVLAREQGRLHELRHAWTTQAERIREMDRLLLRPEKCDALQGGPALAESSKLADRLRGSRHVIRQNLERLQKVRTRALEDLLGTLAWVRELASMIHLAKFTGAPASRAEELVAQIAAAVEGLSAASADWEQPAHSFERLAPAPVEVH